MSLVSSFGVKTDVTTDVQQKHTHAVHHDRNESSKWTSLNVALVQYPLVGFLSLDELYAKVKGYILRASVNGAQVVVIPELFTLDMLDFTRPEIEQFDTIIADLFPSFMTEMQTIVNELNIHVLAGSTPVKVNGKIRNRSFLFGPHCEPVHQDKIFLTPDEVEWGWEASDKLSLVQTPWGMTAIIICYDSEFPLISQTLAQQQVNVVLVPSMTGDSGFTRVRWASQARAIEHMAYVMVTGTAGAPAPGWEMKAQAAVLGPSLPGFTPLIAEGELNKENEIVFAKLDLSKLAEAKKTGLYYPALDQEGIASIEVETTSLE
jgi:predicted amidohydrolase